MRLTGQAMLDWLDEKYGEYIASQPVPERGSDEMALNPFAFLRLKCGLSQSKFCARYGFSKQTVIGIESGMYPDLSDRMIVSLGKACADAGVNARMELLVTYGVERLQQAYKQWQAIERQEAVPLVNGFEPTVWTEELSPMHCLVVGTVGSLQGFAKRLKVPPATLVRYTRGEQDMMPKSIYEAFRQIRYPYLLDLIRNQAEWVASHAVTKGDPGE